MEKLHFGYWIPDYQKSQIDSGYPDYSSDVLESYSGGKIATDLGKEKMTNLLFSIIAESHVIVNKWQIS